MHLSIEEVLDVITTPLVLPPYPNHTQAVERMVRVVTEVATKRAGYSARHRLILNLLKSRTKVPQFNSKKDDIVDSD